MCAAARATGLRRRDRGLPFDPERIGLLTLATLVLIFGLHSLIDWTWFVPGNAVVALLCGRLGGRAAGRSGDREAVAASRRRPARRRRPAPLAGGAAAVVLIAAVAASWAALQPVRSARSDDRAQDAADSGKYDLAASRAKAAERQDPLSLEPLWLLAFIADAEGKPTVAARYLERAVRSSRPTPRHGGGWAAIG